MRNNDFIPPGLSLISDYVLLKTISQYHETLSGLVHIQTPASQRLRLQIVEALEVIDGELDARGLRSKKAPEAVLPVMLEGSLGFTYLKVVPYLN